MLSTDLGYIAAQQYHMRTMSVKKIALDNWSDKRYRINIIETEPFNMKEYKRVSSKPIKQRFQYNMQCRAENKGLDCFWDVQ